MKVAIIGYGNMGKEIEKVLVSRGHEISKVIDIENNNEENDKITEVVQKGYLLNNRVIKPALVIVIKNKQ